jgi:ankyrin repeat protein
MDNIKSLHASIINGDINNVERILTDDPLLIKAKDENGLFPIHIATAHNQPEIVNYMVVNFPATIHFKDNVSFKIVFYIIYIIMGLDSIVLFKQLV